MDETKSGHRERLRERFAAGEEGSRTEEALLELLLSYSIPQRDVQPLAKNLIAHFGSLTAVLAAPSDALCKVDGIKAYSGVLVKLVDWIRSHYATAPPQQPPSRRTESPKQPTLFERVVKESGPRPQVKEAKAPHSPKAIPRRGTDLFGKAILREAIDMLPRLPETESLDEVRAFLKSNLHFNAAETRRRYSDYIARRMFLQGYADKALRTFAKQYAGRQELRDVCFYRFCKAEPLMPKVMQDLFLSNMGVGQLGRSHLRDYLAQHFQAAKSIHDCAQAIVEACVAAGIVKADRTRVIFAYREVSLPSFAFVVHSEFPEAGMYDIAKLETNPAIRALLWNPSRLLPSLYELRNQGLISKVSEIDNVRQFTTRWSLEQVVERLVAGGGKG